MGIMQLLGFKMTKFKRLAVMELSAQDSESTKFKKKTQLFLGMSWKKNPTAAAT